MRIAARLKRAEKAVGIGKRCLSCRVHYIRFGNEIRRTAPDDLDVTTCQTCKQTLKLIHSGYTKRERFVLASISSSYHSEPAQLLAGYVWMHHLPRFREIEQIGEDEEKRLRGLVRSDNWMLRESARKQVKVLDEDAAQKIIEQEAVEKRKQRTATEEDVYASVLTALDDVSRRRAEIKDHDLFCYNVMAEMEVFMWGEKSEETLKLIEDRQRQIDEEEAERQREAEERERQREEERQRREEERKRQHEEYRARTCPAQPPYPDKW